MIRWTYWAVASALFVLAGALVWRSRSDGRKPWSIVAVLSAVLSLMHPTLWWIVILNPRIGIPWVGRGNSEILSFGYSAFVLVISVAGLVWVLCSKGRLRGLLFSIIGLLVNAYFCWIWIESFFQMMKMR